MATTGNVIQVNPGDDIQSIINSAPAGSTIHFNSGTYEISNTIDLKSNLTYQGASGVTLQATGQNNIMQGNGVSNVTIEGINFDGGPDKIGIQDAQHAGVMLQGSNNVSVINNSFQNINADACVFVYNSDGVNISNNTAGNVNQFVSAHATDGAHNNLTVDGNTVDNAGRMGVEIMGTFNNMHVDGNTMNHVSQMAFSVVDDAQGENNVTIIGNHVNNSGIGIETADPNMLVADNTVENTPNGVWVSHGHDTVFVNNTFTNVSAPFGEDGGYTGEQYVGTNTVDGQQVDGWSGHPNGSAAPSQTALAEINSVLTGLNGASGSSVPTTSSSDPSTTTTTASDPSTTGDHTSSSTTTTGGNSTTTATTGGASPASGSSTLVLQVSGDQLQGDPQIKVLVDGHQVGDTYDVTAHHSLGQTQQIELSGNWDPSVAHQVQIEFVNDLWNGSNAYVDGYDRNVYVQSVTLNGTTEQGQTFASNNASAGQDGLDAHAAVMTVNGAATYAFAADPSASTVGSGTTTTGSGATTTATGWPTGSGPVSAGAELSPTFADGSGHEVFMLHSTADAGATITHFDPSTDIVDLAPVLKAMGYTGTDPVKDHVISLEQTGSGDTTIMADPHGVDPSHGQALVTLQHVLPSQVPAGDIWH